jgi:hypothetical protein
LNILLLRAEVVKELVVVVLADIEQQQDLLLVQVCHIP